MKNAIPFGIFYRYFSIIFKFFDLPAGSKSSLQACVATMELTLPLIL